MNVLIYPFYSFRNKFFGSTCLEIIQSHLDQGHDISMCACRAELPACESSVWCNLTRCAYCVEGRKAGTSLLHPHKMNIRPLNQLLPKDREDWAALPSYFTSIEALKNFCIEGFDIGYAVSSSLIHQTKNPYPDTRVTAKLVQSFLLSAFVVFRSAQNYFSKNHIDRVYTYNGRFACQRAVLRACQNAGVECLFYEGARDYQHYELYKNALCCDLKYKENEIVKYWERSESDPEREKIASKYFTDRMAGIAYVGRSFIAGQREGMLPPAWDANKKNIAIFLSSEDEFAAIGVEWENPIYQDQLDGLRQIVDSLKGEEDIHLYVRMHPRLKGVDNEYMKGVYKLAASNLTLIPPEDPISTYALMQHADQVLTFGSTTGIEAVFCGIPSILAGKSYYGDLGGTYNPSSHEDLVQLLKSALPPKSKTAALMYGYYMNSFGIRFKYCDAFEGKFKNKTFRPVLWIRLVIRLYGKLTLFKRAIDKIFFMVLMKEITGHFAFLLKIK